MDPNAALESILNGHMVADHAEALEGWLMSGGFLPVELLMPADKHPFFAEHCERVHGDAAGIGIRVRATIAGVWTYGRAEEDWILAAYWKQLKRLED